MNDTTASTMGSMIKSTRPPFLILTPICIFLGVAISQQLGLKLNSDIIVLVTFGALCAHISVNTFNEYFDFRSGLDLLTQRTPFSGGSGSLPTFPRALKPVLLLAVVSLLTTCIIGLYLVSLSSMWLIALGLTGVVLIVAYTKWVNQLPILCLIAPGSAFGPMFVLGTYLCLAGESIHLADAGQVFLVSLVPFFLVNNLLLLNQLPDIDADKQVGRKTFPIAYGHAASLKIYSIFNAGAILAVIASVALGSVSPWALTTLLVLSLGFSIAKGMALANSDITKMIPFMGKNVALTLLGTFIFALSILLPSQF